MATLPHRWGPQVEPVLLPSVTQASGFHFSFALCTLFIDDLIGLNFSFHSKQLPIFSFIRREEKHEMIAFVGTMFAYP